MVNKAIRKISVGSDVNAQLHISVGSTIGGKKVDTIKESGPKTYEVWVEMNDNKDIAIWKTIVNMPCIIEYNTRLE